MFTFELYIPQINIRWKTAQIITVVLHNINYSNYRIKLHIQIYQHQVIFNYNNILLYSIIIILVVVVVVFAYYIH